MGDGYVVAIALYLFVPPLILGMISGGNGDEEMYVFDYLAAWNKKLPQWNVNLQTMIKIIYLAIPSSIVGIYMGWKGVRVASNLNDVLKMFSIAAVWGAIVWFSITPIYGAVHRLAWGIGSASSNI